MPGSYGGDGFRQHGHQSADDGGTLAPSSVLALIPSGVILPYGGAAAPDGFVLCDGAAISRTTYATLFTALGTAYGVGDGSTTFNVPDMRGRSPLGSGTGSGLTARTIGQTAGEESHALTSDENGQHTHTATVTDGGHIHNIKRDLGGVGSLHGVSMTSSSGSLQDNNNLIQNDSYYVSNTSVSNANSGTGAAHNTMHPFTVCNFIIKT